MGDGSGLTPEPKDINEIHKYIKDVVQSNSANKLIPEVLYGGSVTDKNAESFFKKRICRWCIGWRHRLMVKLLQE